MSLLDKWAGQVAGFFDEILLPDDLHVTLLRARKAVEQEQHSEALRLLSEIDARKPGMARVRELQGVAMIGQGDYQGAARLLHQAALQRPAARTFRTLALALELDRDWRAAREALREAQRLGPDRGEQFYIQHGLGRVYLGMRRPDKAVRELRKALRFDSEPEGVPAIDLARARVNLARALLKRGEPGEVHALMADLLPEAGADAGEVEDDAALPVGQALLALGDAEAALPHLSEVARRRPGQIEALVAAGRAALLANRPEQARSWLEHAAPRCDDADRVQVLTLLAEALLALGQAPDARLHLSRALRLRPDDPEALRVSAWATLAQVRPDPKALDSGEYELTEDDAQWVHGAEAQLARLRQLRPESSEALYGLGRCRMLRGDWSGARRFLSMAVAAGDDERAVHDLAVASAQTDGPAEAVATLTALLKRSLSPATRDALTALLDRLYSDLVPGVALPAGRDIVALTEAAQRVTAWIAETPRVHRFLAPAQRLVDALDAPLDVAIVGEFNAGKSTLVNGLIGESVVPTGVLPTTAHINVMRFGPRRTAQLHFKDGRVEEVAFPDVRKRLKRSGEDAISHLEYLYPHPELRRVHIWDTPGLNSPNAAHEAHARRALAQAEAIFWVCDASQALSESEKAQIDTIEDPTERLVVLINKVDRLGPPGDGRDEAVAEVRRHIDGVLGDRARGIFALSGLEGLKARTSGDEEALERSGLGPLLRFAEGEVFDRAARLKASVASRALRALAQELQEHGRLQIAHIDGLLGRVDALQEGVEAEEQEITGRLTQEERERLASGVDFLLMLIAREVSEAMHPNSRLIDALLPRAELEPEDVEFVLELTVERFGDLLKRSEERVNKALLEVEQRFVDSVDALADRLDPEDARTARRRLEAYLSEARALRLLLGQRVYGRYRLIAEGRATGPEVGALIARQARQPRDLPEEERKAALKALLPDVEGQLEGHLEAWAREYFDAARRLCDLLRGDLDVLRVEAAALSRVLASPDDAEQEGTPPADGEAP
ncbi:MAG: hypothetical protein CMH57_07785 [Myxococcales bacterium]|nr:hypothetical protein [Myxococcales bacterium]